MNHFACGGFHSSTFVHGVDHSSSDAKEAQKPSGSLSARAYTPSSLMFAFARNAGDGGKVRSSWSRSAISAGGFLSAMTGFHLRVSDGRIYESTRLTNGNS